MGGKIGTFMGLPRNVNIVTLDSSVIITPKLFITCVKYLMLTWFDVGGWSQSYFGLKIKD